MENCILCKKRPIHIKKRGLCNNCYQQQRRKVIKKGKPFIDKIPFAREIIFVKNFFTHKNWFYQAANFRLNGGAYSPDFYDGERNVFIEVVGSRQAYHQNKHKYEVFRKTFPLIKLEIRNTTGEIVDNTEENNLNSAQTYSL